MKYTLNNNKQLLRSNTKGYGGKTHDTTATSGRELYHLQFSLHVASLEIFGYTLVHYILVCLVELYCLSHVLTSESFTTVILQSYFFNFCLS
jgi:hypothetical protein